MRSLLTSCLLGSFVLLAPSASSPGQWPAPDSPGRGVVFLRVIGEAEVTRPPELALLGAPRTERLDVEIGTGSGFLVSTAGHILTAAHVVSDSEVGVAQAGRKVLVKLKVRRIEAVLPPDGRGTPITPYEATVIAVDPDNDLALLSIPGSGLPVIQFGDSDAVESGDAVEAIGFPFGRDVELARPADPTTVAPEPSLSRGNVSAFRADVQGRRRFLQTTATLNPGNSGGPVLDADGFAVGVVSRSLVDEASGGAGLGFAIPINVAKDFLESRGMDSVLAARRLVPGSPLSIDRKALRLQPPYGLTDISAARARFDTGGNPAETTVLRIDRVVSPWSAQQLADALSTGGAFEPISPTTAPAQRRREAGGRRQVLGHVTGTLPDGSVIRIEYAVIESGAERIVARFLGPPAQLAFNLSVVRASLLTVDGDVLRRESREGWRPAGWEPVTMNEPSSAIAGTPLPSGWVLEPIGPQSCPGLPTATDVVSASPAGDFTVALRVAWVRRTAATAEQAAALCGRMAGNEGSNYEREAGWLGTSYLIEGAFVAAGPGDLLQLEGIALAQQAPALRAVMAEWVRQVTTARRR